MTVKKPKHLTIACFTLLTTFFSAYAFSNTYQTAKAEFDQGNTQQAIDIWTTLAQDGDSQSQFALGAIYATGNGALEANDQESIKWFKMAAEQGHTVAQYNLGNAYERGRGVKQDYGEAVNWWQQAADRGHAPALFNLGTHYFFGRGIEQDSKKAEELWYKASLQNHAPAQFNLATLYKFGPENVRNNQKAMHWYRIAARNGHTGAQRFLLNDATNTGEQSFPESATIANTDKTKQDVAKKNASINEIAAMEVKPLPEAQPVSRKQIEPTKSDVKIIGKPRNIGNGQDITTQVETKTDQELAIKTKQSQEPGDAEPKHSQKALVNNTAKSTPTSAETSKAEIKEQKITDNKPSQTSTIVAKSQPKAASKKANEKVAENANTQKQITAPNPNFAFNITHREDWIRQQDSQHYTLQLAAFRTEKQVVDFLNGHKLKNDVSYFTFVRDNIQWYAVLYGSYASSAEAKAQIKSLPKALQKPSPWLRRYSAVHKLIN